MNTDADKDHELIMSLSRLLNQLKGSYVEKYAYFYHRDPSCAYVHKAKKAFILKDKKKMRSLIDSVKKVYKSHNS